MSLSELSDESDISFPEEEDEGPNIGVGEESNNFVNLLLISFNFPTIEIHRRSKC